MVVSDPLFVGIVTPRAAHHKAGAFFLVDFFICNNRHHHVKEWADGDFTFILLGIIRVDHQCNTGTEQLWPRGHDHHVF